MENETAKIIKARLLAMRKTQGWLAEVAGVSVNAVSKWTKTGKIGRANVQAVADALEITADQLLAGTDQVIFEVVPIGQTTLERLSPDEKEVLEEYRRSTTDGKLMIFGSAKSAPKASPLRSIKRIN